MNTAVIAVCAFLASGLTLFSGFGLGTLLMPVVAIFFPLETAIAITAIVHLANNFFKLALMGRNADRAVVTRFGIPALISSFAGAFLLVWLSSLDPVLQYSFIGRQLNIMPVKLIVGIIIIIFVLLELSPGFQKLSFGPKALPAGGVISGFFGGLSGHQGAFRSMFLIKAGLNKDQFISTGVVIAVMVDFSRLLVYGWDIHTSGRSLDFNTIMIAILSAFAGVFIGSRLLKKMTIKSIQVIVSLLLAFVAIGLIVGLI